jgi:hypothetical protein
VGSAAAGWLDDFVWPWDWPVEAASELEEESSDESVVAEESVVEELSVEVLFDDVAEDAAGITALTAPWQADESLATFFSRH